MRDVITPIRSRLPVLSFGAGSATATPAPTPVKAARPARPSVSELAPLDQTQPPWPGRHEHVRGCSLFVRTTPGPEGAPPALYVHGLGGASTNWTDLSAQLSGHVAGEAVDLPGFGRSGPPVGNDYSIAAHAEVLAAYLDQSARGPVHLVGNSLGGEVCIRLASSRPDLVRSLALISPAVPDVRLARLRSDPATPLVALPGIGQLLMRYVNRQGPENRARGVLQMCYAHPEVIPANRWYEGLDELRYRADQAWAGDAFIRSLRGLIATYFVPGQRSVWSQLARIEVPSVVIWGRQDRLVAVDLADRVARTLPDARLLVLDEVGHVAMLEAPVDAARAVLGLIEQVEAPVG